jgi:maltose/moltooligosaccharide transporter
MSQRAFGWIFENLLGSSGANAIILSGALLCVAALAMLWIRPPAEDEESELMPLGGAARDITVYDQVIVGSDGTPSSLYAVDRAHAVAAEADAHVVVVSAYNPGQQLGVVQASGNARSSTGRRPPRPPSPQPSSTSPRTASGGSTNGWWPVTRLRRCSTRPATTPQT